VSTAGGSTGSACKGGGFGIAGGLDGAAAAEVGCRSMGVWWGDERRSIDLSALWAYRGARSRCQ
jgi:hypothetical protein